MNYTVECNLYSLREFIDATIQLKSYSNMSINAHVIIIYIMIISIIVIITFTIYSDTLFQVSPNPIITYTV